MNGKMQKPRTLCRASNLVQTKQNLQIALRVICCPSRMNSNRWREDLEKLFL